MTEDEIKENLEMAVMVILAMPCNLRKLDVKSSMPEIIRNGQEWIEWNNEGAKSRLMESTRFRPTPKQIDEAMIVMDWIRFGVRRHDRNNRRLASSVVFIKSMGMGFRRTCDVLEAQTGQRIGKDKCKRIYDQAIMDIQQILSHEEYRLNG